MITFFVIFIIISAFIAFSDWRRGMLFAIVVGVLQDPIRKLTPGAPAIFVLSSLPVWLSIYLGIFSRDGNPLLRFEREHPLLYSRIKLFALSLILATAIVFQYGMGAWKVAVVGVFGYLNPVAALVAGYTYARQAREVETLMIFYCVVTSIVMAGTLIEYLNIWPAWPALGTEAMNMKWIRYRPGYILEMVAGFYRSPDVMGWHAATLVMFGLTLMFQRGFSRGWTWLAAAVWGAVCVLLGGRRKSVMMPAIWACVVALAYLRAEQIGRVVRFSFIMGALVLGIYYASGEVDIQDDYFTYATTDPAEVSQRVQAHSWKAVLTTYRQSGFFGLGIGSACLGKQHLGLKIKIRGWQEGGLSRMMVELGVIGLVCGILFAVTLAKGCYAVIRSIPPNASSYPLLIGLAAFVVANACSFIVSHQIYNDAMIMTLTAFFVGVVLSGGRWCHDQRAKG